MQHELIFKHKHYKIIGICMEVHRILGGGLSEVLYKDALEYEFKQHHIHVEREKEYTVRYKSIILPHKFYADFIVYGSIVLEIKSVSRFEDKHIAQVINYVKLTGGSLGILINFGNKSLENKRIVV